MDQPKLERLLRLMKLLTANTTYNVDQLAERLRMSRRTIYRYIDTFREAGFVIKKSGDCIRLDKESPHFRDISQLVHFTEEEAVILKSAIESIDDSNLLKQNLKRKLCSVYDNKTLADTVVRGRNAPNIRRLIEAIEERRQVVLHGYRSAHGGEVRDRRVEPFAFTTNYVQVWCYDPESGSNKLFKTLRIGEVEPTETPWEHAGEHAEADHVVERVDLDAEALFLLGAVFLRAGDAAVEGVQQARDHQAQQGGIGAAVHGRENAADAEGQREVGRKNGIVVNSDHGRSFISEKLMEPL